MFVRLLALNQTPGEEVLTQVARQERVYREHIVQLTSSARGDEDVLRSLVRDAEVFHAEAHLQDGWSTVEPCSEAHKYPLPRRERCPLRFVPLPRSESGRLIEMSISRRHQHALSKRGRRQGFPTGLPLDGLAARWRVSRRSPRGLSSNAPFVTAVAIPMIVVFLLSNALRWWVIFTLAEHWNVQVMDSLALGVVTDGPFRWIRHPNYLAVFSELLAVPLIHTAWLTAAAGSLAHVSIPSLSHRSRGAHAARTPRVL